MIFTLCSCSRLQTDEEGNLVPLTVKEDASLSQIVVGEVTLHSETFGDPADPMIIMLHGGPGGDYRGLLNFKELSADGYYVVFYDQRGSGLSERLDESAYDRVQVYVDELEGVIEHYRQDASQKIVLAGHSWGAMLAAAYIDQNPDEIDGAVFIEPGGFTWEQTSSYIKRSKQLNLASEVTNDIVYQDQFITGHDHQTLDYKLGLSTVGNVNTGDETSAPFWRYGAICNIASIQMAINNPDQMDFTTNLKNFPIKTLFAYSELNSAYGAKHAQDVSSALAQVTLAEIKGCGHEIPQYGWDNLYPILKSYLQEIL